MLPFRILSPESKNVHVHLCQCGTRPAISTTDPKYVKKNFFTACLVLNFKSESIYHTFSRREGNFFISGSTRPREKKYFCALQVKLMGDSKDWPQSYSNYCSRAKSMNEIKRYRLADSEMQFLSALSMLGPDGTNSYIEDIVSDALSKGPEELTSIELHGFTTRDMCPCCFHHMLGFLMQANNGQKDRSTFFGALLSRLRDSRITIPDILPISFYISSLVELGGNEYTFSRYPTYANAVAEKTPEKVSLTLPNNDMHCIFLRTFAKDAETLTLYGKDEAGKETTLRNANGLVERFLDGDFVRALRTLTPPALGAIPRDGF